MTFPTSIRGYARGHTADWNHTHFGLGVQKYLTGEAPTIPATISTRVSHRQLLTRPPHHVKVPLLRQMNRSVRANMPFIASSFSLRVAGLQDQRRRVRTVYENNGASWKVDGLVSLFRNAFPGS
jgi:hypothetical protein